MKKLLIGIVLLTFGLIFLHYAGDHYRYELYDWALDFESSKAQMELKSGSIGNEQYAYLEGPKVDGQKSIVLLHGFGASKENWLRFAAHLTDQYHVVALDLAGHGDNKPDFSRPYSHQDQVEFVHQMTAAIGVDHFFLAGNSMGGGISSLYAARYPEQVMGVVLISPSGIHDIPSKLDEMLEEGKNPLIADSIESFEALLDFAMEDKPFIPAPILKVEAEKAISRVAINKKIFKELRADMKIGFAQKLKTIKAPVLIIWGKEDRAINVANIDKYAELIPNARKLVMEGIGHVAMIESPEFTALAMLDFISNQ